MRTKFSALSIDFIAASFDPLGSRKAAHADVKERYPLKSGYFTVIGLCSVKTLANWRRHAAYHYEH